MKKLTPIIFCVILTLILGGCKTQTQISYLSYYEDLPSLNQQTESSQALSSKDVVSQKEWESTVSAPVKVAFYKDGQEVISTDKEQNLKIAKHIESYYKGMDKLIKLMSAISDADVMKIKGKDMAIELFFDAPVSFYGGCLNKATTTLFIPVTGSRNCMIIENIGKENYDSSSGPLRYNPKGLEKFFPEVFNQPQALGAPEYYTTEYGYKSAWGKYVETQKANPQGEYDENDLYVFKNDEGVTIKKDVKTGELVFIDYNVKAKDNTSSLTQQSAIEAAKNAVANVCDLSPYDKQITQTTKTGMTVKLIQTINGFDTVKRIVVEVNKDGSIRSIFKTPDIFGDTDLSKISITEEQIFNKVRQRHIEENSDVFFNLQLYSVTITLKNQRLQANVLYQELNKNGNEMSQGKPIQMYIPL